MYAELDYLVAKHLKLLWLCLPDHSTWGVSDLNSISLLISSMALVKFRHNNLIQYLVSEKSANEMDFILTSKDVI